jgi:hypothetical protein
MPAKVLKKLLEDFRLNDEEGLTLNDQGITNILEIPELSNFLEIIHSLILKN